MKGVEMDSQKERWLSTNEFAELFRVKGESVRRSLCVNGHYMGVVPIKPPNGRLLWPKSEAAKLLNKEVA
jgi:hypothetical protein